MFFVVVKSPIHSPRRTCIVCQMSRKIYALVMHFSKKILLTMDLAVLSSCGHKACKSVCQAPADLHGDPQDAPLGGTHDLVTQDKHGEDVPWPG